MGNFFKADNWFFTGVTKLMLLIIVTAMFVICSIPVFTLGASFSGLYYAINKNLKFDRGYTFQCFFEGFKTCFKKSTLANLMFLGITLVLLGDTAAIQTLSESGKMDIGFQVFFFIVLALVWLYAIWVFAYISTFDNDLKSILKNCFILFFAELPTTLYTAVIIAFVALVVYLILPLLIIMPGVGVWLISHRMHKSFRKYMTDDQKAQEDEINQMKMEAEPKVKKRNNKFLFK